MRVEKWFPCLAMGLLGTEGTPCRPGQDIDFFEPFNVERRLMSVDGRCARRPRGETLMTAWMKEKGRWIHKAAAVNPHSDAEECRSAEEQKAEEEVQVRLARVETKCTRLVARKYWVRVNYFIRKKIRDDHKAEDVSQNVWEEVFRRLDNPKKVESFKGLLFTIARQCCVEFYRQQDRERKNKEGYREYREDMGEPDLIDFLERKEKSELVNRTLEELSADHMEVFIFSHFVDMSNQEIADILEIPLGTVKSRLHHAHIAFRAIWKELDHD